MWSLVLKLNSSTNTLILILHRQRWSLIGFGPANFRLFLIFTLKIPVFALVNSHSHSHSHLHCIRSNLKASSYSTLHSYSRDVHCSASATTCSAVLASSTFSRVIGTTSCGPLTAATPNLIMIVVDRVTAFAQCYFVVALDIGKSIHTSPKWSQFCLTMMHHPSRNG